MPQPIFVIGKNRSGTKWLSTIIASHKNVASVQSKEVAGGILESNTLNKMYDVFGSLEYDNNFIAFLECKEKTSFFQITGLKKDFFYEKRPRTYFYFFRLLMDSYAEKINKEHWIQKADVLLLEGLYKEFPDAKFVIVERDAIDNIKSTIKLRSRKYNDYKKNILKELASYVYRIKKTRLFKENDNVIILNFKDLQFNRKSTINKICQFLSIEIDENMFTDTFEKNTSFKTNGERNQILNNYDELMIEMFYPILSIIPLKIYKIFHNMFRRCKCLYNYENTYDKFLPSTFLLFKKYNSFQNSK